MENALSLEVEVRDIGSRKEVHLMMIGGFKLGCRVQEDHISKMEPDHWQPCT